MHHMNWIVREHVCSSNKTNNQFVMICHSTLLLEFSLFPHMSASAFFLFCFTVEWWHHNTYLLLFFCFYFAIWMRFHMRLESHHVTYRKCLYVWPMAGENQFFNNCFCWIKYSREVWGKMSNSELKTAIYSVWLIKPWLQMNFEFRRQWICLWIF